jgi:hypothetical protein
MCKNHLGKDYSADCDFDCEYAASIQALKELKVSLEHIADAKPYSVKAEVQNALDLYDSFPLNLN